MSVYMTLYSQPKVHKNEVNNIVHLMANQLEQEVLTAQQSSPEQLAEKMRLATAKPALCTIDILRGEERKRLASLAITCLNNHSQAEEKAKLASHLSTTANTALHWGRLLWLLPTLITRDSLDTDQEPQGAPPESDKNTRLKLRALIKQRLQMAEQGQWDQLLTLYLTNLEAATTPQRGANHSSLE